MRHLFLFFFLFSSWLTSAQVRTSWGHASPLPEPRSNMATCSINVNDTVWVYTFMGLDSTKLHSGISTKAWKYNTVTNRWFAIPSVPDTEGRLAASASAVNGKIYLIGGYKVFEDSTEFTSPRVDIYDPLTDTWSLGDSTPTPIDDHVQVVWKDSLIYTISGWSNFNNVKRVQIYNPFTDTWTFGRNVTGPGVFGHSGAISGNSIYYIDGVRIFNGAFQLFNQVWRGDINPADPSDIVWTSLSDHPHQPLYRTGGFFWNDHLFFTGGTHNAYNFDGIGYDSVPSPAEGLTMSLNLTTNTYQTHTENPWPTMDVRQVVRADYHRFFVVGGMDSLQQVTNRVSILTIEHPTGVSEKNLIEPRITLYPNPASGSLWIDFSNAGYSCQYQPSVVDLSGKEVSSIQVDALEQGWRLQWPAQTLSGLYFVRLQSGQCSDIWQKVFLK